MHYSKSLVSTSFSILLLLCSTAAVAQIEEIVVTAQQREQSARDIGLTIEAFDEDSYRELATLDAVPAQVRHRPR